MKNLIHNELIKSLYKKSSIIFIIIFLIFAAAFPILNKKLVYDVENSYSYEVQIDGQKRQIEAAKKSDSAFDLMTVAAGEAQLPYLTKMNEDKRMSSNYYDFRAQAYQTILIKSQENAILQLFLDKKLTLKEIKDQNYIISPDVIDQLDGSEQSVKAYINTNKKEIAKQQAIIDKDDYQAATKDGIKMFDSRIKETQKELDAVNNKLKTNATNEQLQSQKTVAEFNLKVAQTQKEMLQLRYDHKIDYDVSNWQSQLLTTFDYMPMIVDQKQFNDDEYSKQEYGSYDNYIARHQAQLATSIKESKRARYEIENNIRPIKASKGSIQTKETTRGASDLSLWFALLASIISAYFVAESVTSEYNKGSIRLLLIRPVSRTKIWMSKYLMSFVVGTSLIVVGTLLAVISSGILYGFSDLMTNQVIFMNDSIKEVPYLLVLVVKLLLSGFVMIFINTLAIFIATLTKSSAISNVVTLVVSFGAYIAGYMALSLKVKWIGYTIFPYFNNAYILSFRNVKEDAYNLYGVHLYPVLGWLMLTILSVIMVILALRNFNKKDIAN